MVQKIHLLNGAKDKQGLVQANVGHLWRVRCNGLLEKQKYERQKQYFFLQ